MGKLIKGMLIIFLCIVMFMLMAPNRAWAVEKKQSYKETFEVVSEENVASLPEVDAVRSTGDVAVNEANFPDANFRTFVSKKCDTDGDGYLSSSEIAAMKWMDCKHLDITSLQGVEYFTAMRWLYCSNNRLTKLDVSGCTALTSLSCDYNQLTVLDVSANTALTTLTCTNNQLTELNVNGNTELDKLYCYRNQLKSLDVSANTALQKLDCFDNQLTMLDVSKNVSLDQLDCYSNQLTTLDVRNNTRLTDLNCTSNLLTALNIRKNTELLHLYCDENQIAELDISHCPKLLAAYNNGGNSNGSPVVYYLSSSTAYLRLDRFTAVITDGGIDINENNFPDASFRAYVSKNCDTDSDGCLIATEIAAVREINCSAQGVASLKGLEYFTALTELDCAGNQLTELDVSNNLNLKILRCFGNQLVKLDVSNNAALVELYCYRNELPELDVCNNTRLQKLDCEGNQLTDLSVNNNKALTMLDCSNNQLTALDVSDNTALEMLYYYNNHMMVDTSNNAALKKLNCIGNQLTLLDVSHNAMLEELYCSGNYLTTLDLSKNTALRWLHCYSNQLMDLDVRKNVELTALLCYDNPFSGLNISRCPKLVEAVGTVEKETRDGWIIYDNEAVITHYLEWRCLWYDEAMQLITEPEPIELLVEEDENEVEVQIAPLPEDVSNGVAFCAGYDSTGKMLWIQKESLTANEMKTSTYDLQDGTVSIKAMVVDSKLAPLFEAVAWTTGQMTAR